MAKKALSEEEQKAQEFVEATAKAIIDLATGVRALLGGKLNKRAIILLITSASTGVRRDQVESVLDAIAKLDKTFLK